MYLSHLEYLLTKMGVYAALFDPAVAMNFGYFSFFMSPRVYPLIPFSEYVIRHENLLMDYNQLCPWLQQVSEVFQGFYNL